MLNLSNYKNTNIYLAPYNQLTIMLDKELNKYGITNLGFIDEHSNRSCVIRSSDIHISDFDYVFIMSPNFYQEILLNFLPEKVKFVINVYKDFIVLDDTSYYINYLKTYNEISFENLDKLDKYLWEFRLFNNFRYKTFPSISNMLYHLEDYKNLLYHYKTFKINCNDIIIDVGAHHGSVSLLFASMGAKVIAYEPNPLNFKVLEMNNILNNNILEINNLAVGGDLNNDEFVDFDIGYSSTTGSLSSLDFQKHTLNNMSANIKKIKVCIKNIKMILIRFARIKLLKIDCEGCEFEIFKSLSSDDLKNVDFILLESHSVAGFNAIDIELFLDKIGFEFFSLDKTKAYIEYICKNNNLRS